MWIFKLVGAGMLACSGIFMAYELNRHATAVLRQNEGMMALIRAIRGQIDCFARPISEILASCERQTLDACGYEDEEIPTDLLSLVERCRVYDAETRAIVLRFAGEFGRGYREDEVRACDYALALLEERRTAIAEALPDKKKRNTALAVCASLAVALLLL